MIITLVVDGPDWGGLEASWKALAVVQVSRAQGWGQEEGTDSRNIKDREFPAVAQKNGCREVKEPRSQLRDPRSGSVLDMVSAGCLQMETPRRQHRGETQGLQEWSGEAYV